MNSCVKTGGTTRRGADLCARRAPAEKVTPWALRSEAPEYPQIQLRRSQCRTGYRLIPAEPRAEQPLERMTTAQAGHDGDI